MSKNANLRKQIRNIIDSERIEMPKRKSIRPPPQRISTSEGTLKTYDLRLLLQGDTKKSAEKIGQNPFTRDISHIQDKIVPMQISLPILPLDIEELKKIKHELPSLNNTYQTRRITTSDSFNGNGNRRNNDIGSPENVLRSMLGNPTGRQDIKELCTWFHSMLDAYKDKDIDTLMLIYEVCARELVRQVTVQCYERGELLQVILAYQPEMFKRKNEEISNEIKNLKAQNHKVLVDLRGKFKKNIQDLEEKLKNYHKIFEALKMEKEKYIEDIKTLKTRYNDFVKKHIDEERVWRNKHLTLLMNLKKNLKQEKKAPQVVVAIANWNKNDPIIEEAENEIEDRQQQFDAKDFINNEILEFQAQYINKPPEPEELLVETSENQSNTGKALNKSEQDLQATKPSEILSLTSIENMEESKKNEESLLKQAQELMKSPDVLPNNDDPILSTMETNGLFDTQSDEFLGKNMRNSILPKEFKEIDCQTESFQIFTEMEERICVEGELGVKDDENSMEEIQEENKEIVGITKNDIENEQKKSKNRNAGKGSKGKKGGKTDKSDENVELVMSQTEKMTIRPKLKIKLIEIQKENDIDTVSEGEFSEESRRSSKIEDPKNLPDLISKMTPTASSKTPAATKKPKKRPQKFSILAKRLSKDPLENKLPSKKEQEFQAIIDDLKQKLKEKSDKLSEFMTNTRKGSSAMSMERLKIGIASSALRMASSNQSFLSSGRDADFPNTSQQIVFQGTLQDDSDVSEEFLIPPGCDYYSWKTGYSSGFEKGRRDGIREGEILGIEENDFSKFEEDKDSSFSGDEGLENGAKSPPPRESISSLGGFTRALSIRTILLKKKAKDLTKIIQFQFSKPVSSQKKHQPASTLLAKFFHKSREFILSKSTLSRKIVNKMIGNIYMNCLSKIKNGDKIECLSEQVYDDFIQKYGLKAVSEKRFLEFVASVFSYSSSHKRIKVFFKFLGCASYVSMDNYSRVSFVYYLSSLQMMLNMKLGVVLVFDEIADKQMFPTIRGIECVREKLEWIMDKGTLNGILQQVQNASEVDGKGINPGGLVELEFVLEIIIEKYEVYQKMIEDGLVQIFTAFNCDEYLGCYELLIAIRHISPDRLDFSEEEIKAENIKKVNFDKLYKEMESKEIISLHEVSTKCVESNLLRISQVTSFCPIPEGLNRDMVIEEIQTWKSYCEQIANNIGLNGKKYKTLDGNLFEDRIRNIVVGINEKEPYHSLLAWRLYESELKRVDAEFFNC